MRAVIYARYSSDLQRAASIEDQVRLCRERIEHEGWTLIVTKRIGLGFNDAPTSSTVEILTHQDFADVIGRKRNRHEWQLRAPQTPERLRGVDGYEVVRSPFHR